MRCSLVDSSHYFKGSCCLHPQEETQTFRVTQNKNYNINFSFAK
jgi:hypothetical protein